MKNPLRAVSKDESLSFRFTLPVVAENVLTIFIGLLFSRIISTISASALAAIGMSNTVMAVVSALFSVVTTGAAVLVSRQIGAQDGLGAAETIEQSLFLALMSSLALTALCMLTAQPMLRLLMPTAEDQLFDEAVRYYQMLLLSLPFLTVHSVLSTVARSMGDSRNPMLVALLMNLCQLAFAYLLISVLHLEETGAGLAYVFCRLLGAGLMLAVLLRNHKYFVLHLRNLLHPHLRTIARILHIGVPVSIESIFVQVGYMLGNSMAIALGTFESGVYQILNTLIVVAPVQSAVGRSIPLSPCRKASARPWRWPQWGICWAQSACATPSIPGASSGRRASAARCCWARSPCSSAPRSPACTPPIPQRFPKARGCCGCWL